MGYYRRLSKQENELLTEEQKRALNTFDAQVEREERKFHAHTVVVDESTLEYLAYQQATTARRGGKTITQ